MDRADPYAALCVFPAASGASAQKEVSNVPCVDIEAFDSDRSCDDVVQCQPMEARELEFGQKGGRSVLGDCPPTSSEPRTSPLELKLRDSGAEPPSPRISQSACLPSNSQSSVRLVFKPNLDSYHFFPH